MQGIPHRRNRDHRSRPRLIRNQGRRIRRHHGPLGMRQVHAPEHPRTARQPHERKLRASRAGGRQAQGEGPHQVPQGQHRIRVPELQPDRRAQRLRERGAASALPQHQRVGAQAARDRDSQAHEHQPPRQALPPAALRRTAAEGGHSTRRDLQPQADPGRRAHRKPRLQERQGGDGPARRTQPRRHHSRRPSSSTCWGSPWRSPHS